MQQSPYGITPGGAHKRVESDYEAWLALPVSMLRDQLGDQYDQIINSEWAAATGPVPDLRAVQTILRATKRRARFFGLYPHDRKDRRDRVGRQIPGDTTDYAAVEREETAILTGDDLLEADLAEDLSQLDPRGDE